MVDQKASRLSNLLFKYIPHSAEEVDVLARSSAPAFFLTPILPTLLAVIARASPLTVVLVYVGVGVGAALVTADGAWDEMFALRALRQSDEDKPGA
jgi:hypothetical protein